MKMSSIIETIKGSIATELSSDVRISDNSFLFNLFRAKEGDANSDRPLVHWSREIFRLRAEDTYPTGAMLARVLKEALFSVVWCFYAFCSCFLYLFTHKWRPLHNSPRFNFVLVLSSLIIAVSLLVSMLTFYINDVLLFSNSTTINRCGALATRQACGEEHYMYLFNTANLWSNTGIEIIAGDRVRISGSGSYYSDIAEKKHHAEENARLSFSLTNVAYPLTKTGDSRREQRQNECEDARYCMYSERDAVYGAMLYQIVGENDVPDSDNDRHRIRQVEITDNGVLQTKPFVAQESGLLHVSVNDIYFNATTLQKIYEERNGQAKGIYTMLVGEEPSGEQGEEADSVAMRRVAEQVQKVGVDGWFRDNCGEILLNVTIERKVNHLNHTSTLDKLYTGSYLSLSRGIDTRHYLRSHLLLGLLGLILFVSLFRVIDRRVIRPRIARK